MQAYIDSIRNRTLPPAAPRVRSTKNALLLQSHREAERKKIDQDQTNGSATLWEHPHPRPHGATPKWPVQKTKRVLSPSPCLPGRPPSSLSSHGDLAHPLAAFSVALSPCPFLFTLASPSPSPATSPKQKGAHRIPEGVLDKVDDTQQARCPAWNFSMEADNHASVGGTTTGPRKLHEHAVKSNKGGPRAADDVTHTPEAHQGGSAPPTPTFPGKSTWAQWYPPSFERHCDAEKRDTGLPLATASIHQHPSSPSSDISPAPRTRSRELSCAQHASAPCPTHPVTSGSPSSNRSDTVAPSGRSPSSPQKVGDLSQSFRWCHPVSAPERERPERAHQIRGSLLSGSHCWDDVDLLVKAQRRPHPPAPSHPSLTLPLPAGFCIQGPEAAIRRGSGLRSPVAHRVVDPPTPFFSGAKGTFSLPTRHTHEMNTPLPTAGRRCRDVDRCSLRDLQKELYARLQRRLHNVTISSSSRASLLDFNTPTRCTSSASLLADAHSTVHLWRDTQLALRRHLKHRGAIHNEHSKAQQQARLRNVEESENSIVMYGVSGRILGARAASRAYLLAGTAAVKTEECTL
ncbi:hypothetical protein JKF63_06551 [Porcisia hertigi]|uniref:Uncharacterized protein n=1 Tax=Porcisia hertigi TaxID=2761500 RepID=A0A836IKJ4_9TRYP|nr:hypothetical protein JKF63_06551 [Porcisia hertigi]